MDLLSPRGVRGEEAYVLFREWKLKVQPTLINSITNSCIDKSVDITPKKRKLDLSEFCVTTKLLSPLPSTPKRRVNVSTEIYSDVSDTEMDNEKEKPTKFDRIRSQTDSDTDDEAIVEDREEEEKDDDASGNHDPNQSSEDNTNPENCGNHENQAEDVIFNGPDVEILDNVNVDEEFPGVVFSPPTKVLVAAQPPVTDEMQAKPNSIISKLESFRKAQGQKVVLNVGGVRFEASKGSLLSDKKSLFAEIFKEGSDVKPSVGGHYFFDRDPAHFRLILNYLRNGCKIDIRTLPKDVRYLYELFYEAQYYNLNKLMEAIVAKIEQVNVLSVNLTAGSNVFQ